MRKLVLAISALGLIAVAAPMVGHAQNPADRAVNTLNRIIDPDRDRRVEQDRDRERDQREYRDRERVENQSLRQDEQRLRQDEQRLRQDERRSDSDFYPR